MRAFAQLRVVHLTGQHERPLEPVGQRRRDCGGGLRHDGHRTRRQPPGAVQGTPARATAR
jgi:hypothetical protein